MITETQIIAQEIANNKKARIPIGSIYIEPVAEDVFNDTEYAKDITNVVFDKVKSMLSQQPTTTKSRMKDKDLSKVFIVHGRDDLVKTEAARFIERIGLTPIILHEQVSAGMTIIEKIEEHSDVGFAIILYTPCDVGGQKESGNTRSRARRNVVFEHGFLVAKLGRRYVCALVDGDVEMPSDISGIVYTPLDGIDAWRYEIAKEMLDVGYSIDMNNI